VLAFSASAFSPLSLLAESEGTLERPTPANLERKGVLSALVTEEHGRSVDRGLAFLVTQQDPDSGAFGAPKARVAVTALSCLALLASGSTPGRGPYGDQVERGIAYLLRHCRPMKAGLSDPESERYYINASEDQISRMHGHGFATLALSEAYGMARGATASISPDELAQKIQGAVDLIVAVQTRDGGWGYEPEDDGFHEGSITVCQLQALRSAKDAGFRVDIKTIEKALDYLRRSQDPDGGFRYSLRDARKTYALTAAAVSTLNAIGIYDQDMVDRGIDYMERHLVTDPAAEEWFYYGNLYACQAFYQHRQGHRFERWFTTIRSRLIDRQGRKGSGAWEAEHQLEHPYGPAYATSCALLVLQVPYQYLPIFQK
jgi:prenyltransferase beta subunit